MKELLKSVWPEWDIVKELGEGGFGKVYEIVRNDMGGTYRAALKVISIPKSQSEVQEIITEGMDKDSATQYFREVVEELVKEFAMMERLKGNTNIVTYEDHKVVPHTDGMGWDILIRMELLTPLQDYMSNKNLQEVDVIKLGIDMCKALEICQRYNIIHRDIKPENIFVSELGDYKLGDFGIARTAEKTTSGMSKKGTYTYMAPEVYRGEAYNATVDLYSLGVVLYRMVNNYRAPFLPPAPQPITFSDRENAQVKRLSGEAFPAPSGASQGFFEVIQKAAAYQPGARFASPTQMREALERLYGQSSDSSNRKTFQAKPAGNWNSNPVQLEHSMETTDQNINVNGRNNINSESVRYTESQPEPSTTGYDATIDMKKAAAQPNVTMPVKPAASSDGKKKKSPLIFLGAGAAAVVLVVILLVALGGRKSGGNANSNLQSAGTGVDASGVDTQAEDVNEKDPDFHILPSKIEGIKYDEATGYDYTETRAAEGCEASAHNNSEYPPESFFGSWVLEGSTQGERGRHPTDKTLALHNPAGEDSEVECLPMSINFKSLGQEIMNVQSPNSQLYVKLAGYNMCQVFFDVPGEDSGLNGMGIYDTHENTLALSVSVGGDTTNNLEFQEMDYEISWTGWKLTLTYDGESATYVPDAVIRDAEKGYVTGGGSVMEGYEPIEEMVSILAYADGQKVLYPEQKYASTDASFTFSEDGNVTMDISNGKKYEFPFLYSGDSITLLTDNGPVVYNMYADWWENQIKDNVDDATLETLGDMEKQQLQQNHQTILEKLKEAFAAAGLDVTIDEVSGSITMNSEILFGFDEAELSEEGKTLLDKFMGVYASVILSDECAGFVSQVVVEGHTDTQGEYDYNLTLSQQRADAVSSYCLSSSNTTLTPEQQTQLSQIMTTEGKSFSEPVYNADGTVNMDASRRVEFIFKMKTGE